MGNTESRVVGNTNNKSDRGRRGKMRHLIFYGLSLLLSLIIVVISTTVFVVVIYLEGSVSREFFILYIGVLATNLVISAVSLRGLIMLYPLLSASPEEKRIFVVQKQGGEQIEMHPPGPMIFDRKYFTESEMEIIDLLQRNSNRMLQSSIVSFTGASKATISRALASLESKGVIVKVRKGVTNEIILSETRF